MYPTFEQATGPLIRERAKHRAVVVNLFMSLTGALLALGLSSCVSYVRPVGEWARPADLRLHSKSLAGVRVAVRCGSIDPEGMNSIREEDKQVCQALEGALQSIGAEIVDPGENAQGETGVAELTLWYLDRAKGAESCSILLSSAHVMSGYTIPCKSSEWSEAELRVTDARGAVLERAPLRVEKYTMQSWLFIPSSLWREAREKQRKRALDARFLRYAQNRVYSQSLRLPSRMNAEAP
jgi:hypothetical protein